MSSSLFLKHRVESASGLLLDWKIECDAFSHRDYYKIAAIVAPKLPPFGAVLSVPSRLGGTGQDNSAMMLSAFHGYRSKAGSQALPSLIVDDVWTTGGTVRKVIAANKLRDGTYLCFVIFARTRETPQWVWPFWKVGMVQLDHVVHEGGHGHE